MNLRQLNASAMPGQTLKSKTTSTKYELEKRIKNGTFAYPKQKICLEH